MCKLGAILLFTLVTLLTGQPLNAATSDVSAQLHATREAALRSARHLANRVHPDGRFEYQIDLEPGRPATRRYNVLRHAGAIYALGAHYERVRDPLISSAMLRAGRYLRDGAIGPLPRRSQLLAVWSKPEITNSAKPLQAKLGGAGLGLVALLSIEDSQPGFSTPSMRNGLGRFILFMQQPDGGYLSKFIPSRGGRQDDWHSLYYPGEATLGLLMLYQSDGSQLWLDAASKALAYLAQKRLGRKVFPADHWALLATQKLFELSEAKTLPVSRTLLVEHARRICERMLGEQILAAGSRHDGAFTEDGRTTPASTRLEGLLAALSFLPPEGALSARIESAAHRGIAFLLRAQVKEGEFAGAIPRAIDQLPSDEPGASEFNRRATEVRIDYVQHALSAMTQYILLLEKHAVRRGS